MKTKRFLTPYDLNEPDKTIDGFLYPNIKSTPINSFLDVITGKVWETGRVVYIGVEISQNDIFAKIVDSGKKIESVSFLLASIEDYLYQLKRYKIGDIISIKPKDEGFKLIKIKKTPKKIRKLP